MNIVIGFVRLNISCTGVALDRLKEWSVFPHWKSKMSRLDLFYRKLLLTKFFSKGWGKPDNLKNLFHFRKIISDREQCRHLVPSNYPIHIDQEEVFSDCHIIHGHFLSPFVHHLPGIMPKEVQTARFQMILPKKWSGELKPVCLHLAGTGDHGFWRRRSLLARPLLKETNIASVILENPYYGQRKPPDQFRSSLQNVSDLFVMGGALVLESLAIFHWLEGQGYWPLGITGISMGGHMASLAASNWHKPLSLIPCLSWSTASSVFTQGVLSGAIPWKMLQEEYHRYDEYGTEVSKMLHSPEKSGKTKTEAFLLGQQFRHYVNTIQDSPSPNSNLDHDKDIDVFPSLTGSTSGQGLGALRKTPSNVPSYSTLAHGASAKTKHSEYKKSKEFKQAQNQVNTSRWLSWRKVESLINSFQGKETALPEEALDFMRGVMDECTHLGNFSVPVDPSLIIIVSASNDAYVPQDSVMSLSEIWPGAEVRFIRRGHIAAFLREQHVFRNAIRDSFTRQVAKYTDEPFPALKRDLR